MKFTYHATMCAPDQYLPLALATEEAGFDGGNGQPAAIGGLVQVVPGVAAGEQTVAGARLDAFGKVFNLGGSEEISIGDLAKRIVELVGSGSELEFIPYDDAYEEGFEDMARRVPDTTRANRLVGFEPSVGLDDIIHSVIADQRA